MIIDKALAEIEANQETMGQKIETGFCDVAPAASTTIEYILPFIKNPIYSIILKIADGIIKGVQSKICNQQTNKPNE